jgi:hypothetical protein
MAAIIRNEYDSGVCAEKDLIGIVWVIGQAPDVAAIRAKYCPLAGPYGCCAHEGDRNKNQQLTPNRREIHRLTEPLSRSVCKGQSDSVTFPEQVTLDRTKNRASRICRPDQPGIRMRYCAFGLAAGFFAPGRAGWSGIGFTLLSFTGLVPSSLNVAPAGTIQ